MAVPGSQRRDQRRRLLMSWTRSAAPVASGSAAGQRTMAEYAVEALPERHPGLATLLPTGLGRLSACVAGIIVILTALLAAGVCTGAFTSLARLAGPRFAHSVAALQACVDPTAVCSFAGWSAQLLLLGSAAVALTVRFMRRHRRDDYSGRYRAWGWLASLLVAASCATQVPVGRAVGVFIAEATGIAFGPSGYGWWVSIAATLLVGVSLWAVLPLHERLATALWLAAGLVAWGVSAAATWLGPNPRLHAGVGLAAWVVGSGLVAIALLVAARSVIREVRGEAGGSGSRAKPKATTAAPRVAVAMPVAAEHDESQEHSWEADDSTATDYTDGSDVDEERDTRHLSKAERKRLRKLARMNRVA
ncbi:MAG: hypothetical protein ACKOB1_13340 [Planctomycetia bacterium]